MNRLTIVILFVLGSLASMGQDAAEWIRQSAISPDGSEIAFSYQGDIFLVSADGGQAKAITFNTAHDYMPVWSEDGKLISFASNRYGNFDVFVSNIEDGKLSRLSYHSNNEYPYTFSKDNSMVIFGGQRLDDVQHRQFPTGSQPETYIVPAKGGRVSQLWTIPAEDVQCSPDGQSMLYHDKKGGENEWRKHHTSSITRDIWIYKKGENSHTQLTAFKGEDRNPVFAGKNDSFYYLSEESGTFNVHRMNLEPGTGNTQITHFDTNPVRYLSASNNGTLCFTQHGDLYTLKGDGEAQLIKVMVRTGNKINNNSVIPVSGSIGEMSVSPSGKEVAYIVRGEVFVSSVEGKISKRITNTPSQEKFVSFSPDGKEIIYASERNSVWGIYSSKKVRDEEPYFFASTLIEEKKVIENSEDNYQGLYSPDGLSIAYIENKTTLKVQNLKSGESKTLLTSDELVYMSDGDQYFKWSPDSKWLLVSYSPLLVNSEVVLVKADGSSKYINLTKSGYGDSKPVWVNGGKQILWFSDREGLRSWANSGNRQTDVYSMFLTQDAWDKFLLTKDEYALLKDIEAKKKKEAKKDTEDSKKKSKKKVEVKDSLEVKIDFDGLDERKARFTIHSSKLRDAVLSKDGETLYYLTSFEKNLNMWSTNLRSKETKMVLPLNARSGKLEWDKDMKKLFLLADGKISTIDLKTKKKTAISTQGEVLLDTKAEREQMFEHVWKRVKTMFYISSYHGADWDALGEIYRAKLKWISNDMEFTEFLSEMLGELNVSHCGARYRAKAQGGDQTASLGIFFDYAYKGKGLKITEIIKGGPMDKASLKVKKGDVITELDGKAISDDIDIAAMLNRKAGKFTSLLIEDASGGTSELITIKPISIREETTLLYNRWVKANEEEVARLSNGRLGYVHIPGMGDGPYRNTYDKVMGKYHDCEALIVDTRFNGGGDLVSDLAMFLTGEKYIEYAIESRPVGYEPTFRWTKPSVAMVNESNYSDGHCFACGYQDLGIGKMIGMPVPGTCSWAGWEMLQNGTINWGSIPVSAKNAKGEWLENHETVPDIVVKNMPGKIDAGIDQQLEAAITELMNTINK
ncbi:MAG: S41 family peptidase [Bacteroidales bacterium]|nr:S41 family peptidase [Bacteroidales bacterium]